MKLFCVIVGSLILMSSNPAFAVEANKEIVPLEWVEDKLGEYLELNWLLEDKVALTQQGKSAQHPTSWSMRITKSRKHYGEFERSMLSLLSFELIVQGTPEAYEKFTAPQKDNKLTFEEFTQLHQLVKEVLGMYGDEATMYKAVEVALMLGDMGKTPKAHELAPDINQPDHDLFLEKVLNQKPEIFATYMQLPEKYRKLIKRVTGLVDFDHVTHLEGSPKKLLGKIKKSRIMQHKNPPFRFELVVHICDVAAALGHVNNQGSMEMHANTYRGIMAVKAALFKLKKYSEVEAIMEYIKLRGNWIGLKASKYPVLVRLACMLRLFSPEDGKMLTSAWTKTPSNIKELLINNFHPLQEYPGKTATYVPAVLLNIFNAKYKDPEFRLHLIITKILPAIIAVKNKAKSTKLTLNFNKFAGYCRDNIDKLSDQQLLLKYDKDGMVEIA